MKNNLTRYILNELMKSNNDYIIGYRSIGDEELDLLLNGETIIGRFDSSSEKQTTSNQSNAIYFFEKPYMWSDKYHRFMVEVKIPIKDINKSVGTYFASSDLNDTKIWTGRRGKTKYELDEFSIKKYSIKDVNAFIFKDSLEETMNRYFNEEYANQYIKEIKESGKEIKILNSLK